MSKRKLSLGQHINNLQKIIDERLKKETLDKAENEIRACFGPIYPAFRPKKP